MGPKCKYKTLIAIEIVILIEKSKARNDFIALAASLVRW